MDYRGYLGSDKWTEIRRVKLKSQRKCEKCGSRISLQIHHITYKNLGCETNKDLQVLCELCHKEFHIIQELKKRQAVRLRNKKSNGKRVYF